MGRQARFDAVGAIQHVISRGHNREAIFRETEDYEDLLSRLKYLTSETDMCILAWSFLPNHIHLLSRTGATPLATFMRRALTGYSLYFNQKYERVGYLFQNRYKSKLVGSEAYCRAVFAYVNRNPLKHGLVSSFTELDSYPWCGHREIVAPRFDDLCPIQTTNALFGSAGSYFSELYNCSAFDEDIRPIERPAEFHPRNADSVVSVIDLDLILYQTAEAFGISSSSILGRGRARILSRARQEFLRRAVHLNGCTISKAASFLGIALPSASSALSRIKPPIDQPTSAG